MKAVTATAEPRMEEALWFEHNSVLAACESESGNDRLVLVEMYMICGDQSLLKESVGRKWSTRVKCSGLCLSLMKLVEEMESSRQ
jgi:hypothetical protein